jgi:hypothetical protein
VPYHEVRTRFLGNIASPELSASPLQVVKYLWGGTLPEFESIEDLNRVINALINGLWNALLLCEAVPVVLADRLSMTCGVVSPVTPSRFGYLLLRLPAGRIGSKKSHRAISAGPKSGHEAPRQTDLVDGI